ncbi:MAG: 23S rRNA (guanosine(2251)-2'-O)-methyltransferase RlmB [Anaerolineales bacterium]|nr:23S rRNA (guanosine(2251)-2'-O)-methyltransferase RlmB [Anaerolineales bacterium]
MLMAEYLYRRNAVLEALRSGRREHIQLWLDPKNDDKQLKAIERLAREKHIPVSRADKGRLGNLCGDGSHQGVVLETRPYPYATIEDGLALARQRNEAPFFLILDLLHGMQNIGILLRTAEICGVHGVIVQSRRAPDITPAVVTHSAGATEHLNIIQVNNLNQALAELKAADIWIIGLDMDERAQTLGQIDLNMPLAIVVGHEGEGLRRLVKQNCDIILRLPMRGHVESLNAAAAGSVMLYQAWGARGFAGS